MIFDSDVIIWFFKRNLKALELIENCKSKYISIQSYMELLQRVKNKQEHRLILHLLSEFDFTTLPLSENIGHRAAIYVEEYSLSHKIDSGDAIIAATAIENKMPLCSGNYKHYKAIKELEFLRFRP